MFETDVVQHNISGSTRVAATRCTQSVIPKRHVPE